MKKLILFGLLAFACCLPALAQQQYAIDWYKISGGGGTSSGSNYTLSATVGQHDAGGPMTGGSNSITSGFWAILTVLETPGAPTLYITNSANAVTVYWQNVSGWSLEQNNSLTAPAAWSTNTTWTTSNGTNYLNLTSPTGNLYFRLIQ